MNSEQPSVILFRPKSIYGVICVPWSLLAIAAPLVRDGISVRIIDENADEGWRKTLSDALDKRPICLGVTALTGRMLKGAIEAGKMASGKTPVVWGGIHASLLPEQTVRASYVDYVISGEGEGAFQALVKCLMDNGKGVESIAGVYYKRDGEVKFSKPGPFIDLSAEPPTPYDLINAEKYVTGWFGPGGRVLDIFTSRGCPHRCKFCYNPAFNARKWRSLDAETSYARLEEFVKRFNLTGVIFRDDFFFANPKRVRGIVELIIKNGLKIEWEADCRVDAFVLLDDEFLDLLARSGLRRLAFGVESGSPRVLEAIGKDITLDQLWKTVAGLKRHNIGSLFHFMIGFPGETRDEVLETYRLIERLKNEMPYAPIIGPNLFTPYPGTELFDVAVKLGFKPPQSLDEWADVEGWTFADMPWVNPSLEAMLDVSRIYYRMGEVFPRLRPILKARRAIWERFPQTPGVERKTLNALLNSPVRQWIRGVNLKRWTNR